MMIENVSPQRVLEVIKKEGLTFTCILVVFALPFSINLTSRAIILMVIVWLLQNNFKRLVEVLKQNKIFWLFAGFYLAMVAALLYTKDLKSGLWELEKGACLFLFPLLLCSTEKIPESKVHLIIKAFIFSNFCFGVVSLVYATYVYFDKNANIFFYHDLVTPLFESHATYYSMYLIFSLVAVFFFYYKDQKRTTLVKIMTGCLTVFFTILIYLLSVRSIIMFYSLGVLVAIAFYTVNTGNWKIGASIFFAFVFFVFIVFRNNPTLRERLYQIVENHKYEMSEKNTEGYNGFTTRLAQWESSLSIIGQHPIIGVAPADVQDELQEVYKKNFLVYCYKNKWNAHNLYLQTTLGLGVIGLVILLAGFFIPLILAVQQKNILYIAFLLLFAFCSITESTLSVQKGIVFYSFFQSLFFFHLLRKSHLDTNDVG